MPHCNPIITMHLATNTFPSGNRRMSLGAIVVYRSVIIGGDALEARRRVPPQISGPGGTLYGACLLRFWPLLIIFRSNLEQFTVQ
jgi:hypothetical protein